MLGTTDKNHEPHTERRNVLCQIYLPATIQTLIQLVELIQIEVQNTTNTKSVIDPSIKPYVDVSKYKYRYLKCQITADRTVLTLIKFNKYTDLTCFQSINGFISFPNDLK